MELGNAYLAALRLPALLSARADALADELDESVSLAVADRDGIRFIHQATRRRAMSLSFRIGDLLPAERTAPGPSLRPAVDRRRLAALAGTPGRGPGRPGLPGRTTPRTALPGHGLRPAYGGGRRAATASPWTTSSSNRAWSRSPSPYGTRAPAGSPAWPTS
ncbi:hypothetical protein SGLAM104S_01302 [Streptomyces glaucescens]